MRLPYILMQETARWLLAQGRAPLLHCRLSAAWLAARACLCLNGAAASSMRMLGSMCRELSSWVPCGQEWAVGQRGNLLSMRL